MNNFTFCSPTLFEFGKNAEEKVGALVKRMGGTKVLVHYGKNSVKKSGLLARVIASLEAEKIETFELGGVEPNPKDDLVYKGIELGRKNGVDFILAVGGGSVIDSAKAIAIGIPYDGDFWDFYCGKRIEKALPVGTVLTIAAAGSEGSTNSVITKLDGNYKRGTGGEALRPKFSVMNPELTFTLPAYQTAAGATDIMAHVFERYFSNTEGTEITDRLCEAVLKTIIKETPIAVKQPDNYDARANIMWAGTIAHNNLCGCDREQDWASHGMEHELSAFFGVTHGAGLAVMFPAWMKFCCEKNPTRFIQCAVRVWNCEYDAENPMNTAFEGIARFEAFLRSIEMPVRISELGIGKIKPEKLAEHIGLTDERTFGGYVKLNKSDVIEIYNLADSK